MVVSNLGMILNILAKKLLDLECDMHDAQVTLSEARKMEEEVLEVPAVPETVVEPAIVTDPAQVQEIKNSIAEGEMILSSGKTSGGRRMSPEELGAVRREVAREKASIGEQVAPSYPYRKGDTN